MTNISLNLSGKIPNELVADLRLIAETVNQLRIPYFLIGATARTLILQYGYNIRPGRATRDIDFGVAVSSWKDYERFRNALIATDSFVADKQPQRLFGKNKHTWIDLVPFGNIESPTGQIAWLPDKEVKMTTHGFSEAFASALEIQIDENFVIKTASLSGLVLLKLIAWDDRKDRRDIQDIFLIMREYLDAGNRERLYDEHRDLINENFDNEFASAEILGRDINRLMTDETRKIIEKVFADLEPIIISLLRENPFDDEFENRVEQLFECLSRGLFNAQS
jgi:predicted nucleotidyltransferase